MLLSSKYCNKYLKLDCIVGHQLTAVLYRMLKGHVVYFVMFFVLKNYPSATKVQREPILVLIS